jgi:hypothetical protein
MHYEYLKQFKNPKNCDVTYQNFFFKVLEEDIKKLEGLIEHPLPKQLVEFYKEIGSGCLRFSIDCFRDKIPSMLNTIFDPEEIYNLLTKTDPYLGHPDLIWKDYQLPFMSMDDWDIFMVMHFKSDNPSAVYGFNSYPFEADLEGIKDYFIEEKFSDFIYNLYHKGPEYYMEKMWI